MPEWLPPVLVFAGVVVSAGLGFAGALLTNKFTNKLTAEKHKSDLQTQLVSQLQVERNHLDEKLEKAETRHAEDLDRLNKRITGFYADKHASRRYIASLENHINRGSPPPPPDPPSGYVP